MQHPVSIGNVSGIQNAILVLEGIPLWERCAYELCASGGGGTATIQQGQAFTLNRSAHGILLLMGDAPRVNQLIGIHNAALGWRRSTMVYQVRWTRPLRVESQGDLFLVGCRQVTGALR